MKCLSYGGWLIALMISVMSEDCNNTHFEYFSSYSLGKQDQLNRTFAKLQPTLSVPNMTYVPSQFNKFNVTDVQVKLLYLDSDQHSSIVGNNTILIMGGKLEVMIEFNWCKYGLSVSQNGTATASLLSAQVLFEKQIQIDQGYIDWKLADAYNVSFWSTNFTIVRISPPNIEPRDQAIILQILNGGLDQQSVKAVAEAQINEDFRPILADNLKNQHYPLDDHFQYSWKSNYSKGTFQANYSLIPTGVQLDSAGLSYTFVSRNKDDSHWKCGGSVPTKELDPKVYGGTQQFIEFSVIENTMRFALSSGCLDTELNQNNWESRMFQFFAGDLYEVIPALTSKFAASTKVTGYCTHSQNRDPTLTKQSSVSFNVTTQFLCLLYVDEEMISEFNLLFESEIEISAISKQLNFKFKGSDIKKIDYKTEGDYIVENRELARLMIEHSLYRLKEGLLFGSGWKIYPRDYPQIIIEEDSIIIYDPTH